MSKNITDFPAYMTIDDLAKILHISRTKAYELVRAGAIRSIRVGVQYRIPVSALEEMEGQAI